MRMRWLRLPCAASGDPSGIDIPVYGLRTKNVSALHCSRLGIEADYSAED